MNSSNANILNSVCLIIIGLWGYLEVTSPTALIPVGFGVALLLCVPGLKKENKVVAHIAVLLTLIILLALVGMRLPKSIDQGGIGLIRVILMIGLSLIHISEPTRLRRISYAVFCLKKKKKKKTTKTQPRERVQVGKKK